MSNSKQLVLVGSDSGGITAKRPAQTHATRDLLAHLGWCGEGGRAVIENLPFAENDATAGSETELQVAVAGRREHVDLPQFIETSDYFLNMTKRATSGDTPRWLLSQLEHFLDGNRQGIWENSWVRFSRTLLSPYANQVLQQDLLADRTNPSEGERSDVHRFLKKGSDGDEQLRIPVSYLLKLSLADVLGTWSGFPGSFTVSCRRFMDHFLNDNTSPETFSFHVVPLGRRSGNGAALARETGKRFLLTQLLLMYANERFGLRESGQQALIYFAPHPPVRQKELNGLISDSFYRELFMSPCLSGWDRGEDKYRYMQLCHQVLSRSQLNAVAKLREARIIINNLVVLPNVSNVSLANNGTHVSLGSRKLSALLSDSGSGFTPLHEKQLGDLVIKTVEHFLPLFVGTYSAAPYRVAYSDFHPEIALGFLPHELDYTHLRMIWRRWQKKARISVFGQPVTPFGPPWIDRLLSSLFGLKGDFVPDFRLIDYLVCLLSTPSSPALDGRPGNSDKLRQDLSDQGVFDSQMSVYLLYKLREYSKMGFSGFEGRYYSLFPSLSEDMGPAVDLQQLLTALAYKMIVQGELNHAMIPDDPSVESERRQVFFASAIGIPTFYVRKQTQNLLMRRIVEMVPGTRPSRRYQGYVRVPVDGYRKALLEFIRKEASDLVEMLSMGAVLDDLGERFSPHSERSASGRLTKGILGHLGGRNPMKEDATEFNTAAECHYRETLRNGHLTETLGFLREDISIMLKEADCGNEPQRRLLGSLPEGMDPLGFIDLVSNDLQHERLDAASLRQLIGLALVSLSNDAEQANNHLNGLNSHDNFSSSVHNA